MVISTGKLVAISRVAAAAAAAADLLFLAAVPEASIRPSTTLSGRTASVYETDTESSLVVNHGDGGANVSVS